MTPTNKLRFVERAIGIPDPTCVNRKVRILQQWWEWEVTYPTAYGEWRDVPVEQEQE